MTMKLQRIVGVIFLFTLFISPEAFSQNDGKEVGLSSNGFIGGAGFLYKKQRTDSTYTRYRLGFLNGHHKKFTEFNRSFGPRPDSTGFTVWDAGLRFSIGNERRTHIKGPLKFIRGIDPSLSLNFNRSRQNGFNRTYFGIRPALGYRLGIHYDIDPHLYFNLNASPNINALIPFSQNNSPNWEQRQYRVNFGIRYGFTFAFKL